MTIRDRLYRIAYYFCMTVYAAFIAYILADRFSGFFLNPAVQFAGVGAGILILYYLWLNKPVSESTDESEVGYSSNLKTERK